MFFFFRRYIYGFMVMACFQFVLPSFFLYRIFINRFYYFYMFSGHLFVLQNIYFSYRDIDREFFCFFLEFIFHAAA